VTRWRVSPWLLLATLALGVAVFMPKISLQRQLPALIAIVDITQSMNVTDETLNGRAVSRLAFVKESLQRAVTQLPCGSKLGLGVFTGFRSFVLLAPVEICANQRELLKNVDSINGQMAWAGGSEIAKGLYLTLRMLKALEDPPAMALLTDGHEAPPINARYRIDLPGEAGDAKGVLIGVGGAAPRPIPKFDPEGNPAGTWSATDVVQSDLYSLGRQGSVENEAMEDTGTAPDIPAALRGTPGQEHLSFLHEAYLNVLATETKFGYARLDRETDLTRIFSGAELTRSVLIPTDLRWIAGILALVALFARYAIGAMIRPSHSHTAEKQHGKESKTGSRKSRGTPRGALGDAH
jgi:mxaL protein